MGLSQVRELGEIETPILLTNTLNVPEAAAAIIEHTLRQPGNEAVRSVNAVVGETNDGGLNDIRARAVSMLDARRAIAEAKSGPVQEGAVGAGRGTIAFGYKGGIGTSSRVTPDGFTVGVLVQSNYGGRLILAGVPIPPPPAAAPRSAGLDAEPQKTSADGSIMIVVATDAPLSDRNLTRLAARAMVGLARTGSAFSNGSGDYAIAFSTHLDVRRTPARRASITPAPDVGNDNISPLFVAVADATEEALKSHGIDTMGLDNVDRKVLNVIYESFAGGPVGSVHALGVPWEHGGPPGPARREWRRGEVSSRRGRGSRRPRRRPRRPSRRRPRPRPSRRLPRGPPRGLSHTLLAGTHFLPFVCTSVILSLSR
jgi:L-aminopeptidase/D-esterase-like protein